MNKLKFEDWQKVDMRVGRIEKVEDVENADKLYKLEVEADKKRTLVAGLKKHYEKQELEGKKCVVLVNLEAKELMGIKSEGMILAAVNDNKVSLIEPDKDIGVGSKIQ